METTTPPDAPSPTTPMPPADADYKPGEYHRYVGHAIPWYVRALWLGFWILCIWYVLTWLIPALKLEMVAPP